MKKALLALLTALTLVFTVAAPVAGADGFREKLTDLKNKIQSAYGSGEEDNNKYVVEKLVKKLVGLVEEKCREKNIEPSQVLDQLAVQFTDENGNIDVSVLTSLIGRIASGETNTGTESSEEEVVIPAGSFVEQMFRRDDMIRQHVADEYKDTLEAGDAQLISMITAPHKEDELRYVLGYFSLSNFTADGKDLKLKNYAGNVEYMEFAVDDDMNFELVEVIQAEEGENYNASVDALCAKFGEERKSFDYRIDEQHRDWEELYVMMSYLEDHPEYERIEFGGELKTLDELRAIDDALFDAIMESAFALAE